MVDLHCHLLPGVDDGPERLEDSVALARALADQGVTMAAATPHVTTRSQLDPGSIPGRCRELADALSGAGVGLEVVPAAEIELLWALEARDPDLRQASYGARGDAVLIESPYGDLSSAFEGQLFDLALRGYQVVLAHPERNPTFQRTPERLRAIADRGVAVQLTASALLRGRSSRSGGAARGWLSDGVVDVVASDAHAAQGPRAPQLTEARRVASGLAGEPAAREMFEDRPRMILSGTALPPRAPRPAKRGWAERLRRRGARRGAGEAGRAA
jgi:protein-tyrosine phosphatase